MAGVAWTIWILVLGLTARRDVAGLGPGGSERVQHLIALAVLGALAAVAIGRRPVAIVLGLTGAGLVGELLQLLTPTREFEVLDLGMDLVGATVGVGAVVATGGAVAAAVAIGVTLAAAIAGSLVLVVGDVPEPTRFADDCGPAPAPVDADPQVVLDLADLASEPLPQRIDDPPVERLRERLVATGELSLEAWFRTDDLAQGGPARVFTISRGTERTEVDVHLGVEGDDLSVRLRTSCELFNWVTVEDVIVEGRPQHVVVTWSAGELATWVDGVERDRTELEWGDLRRWDPAARIVVGDEVGGGRPFDGVVDSVTMWDGALDDATIAARAARPPR